MMARERVNNQKTGAKDEAKCKTQHKKPQMKRGSFLPNLSEIGLTTMLPMKKPAKITEVDTKPKDPRSHTRSNYESKQKYYIKNVICKMMHVQNILDS